MLPFRARISSHHRLHCRKKDPLSSTLFCFYGSRSRQTRTTELSTVFGIGLVKHCRCLLPVIVSSRWRVVFVSHRTTSTRCQLVLPSRIFILYFLFLRPLERELIPNRRRFLPRSKKTPSSTKTILSFRNRTLKTQLSSAPSLPLATARVVSSRQVISSPKEEHT